MLFAAAGTLIAAGGCARGARGARYPTEPRDSRTIRLSIPARLGGFGVQRSHQDYPAQLAALVYDGLTLVDERGEIQPGLARSWDVSGAGSRYTFHLRTNVRFHDGTKFTAADVERSWRSALRQGVRRRTHPWMLDAIVGAGALAAGQTSRLAGVRVIDDSTIEVTLARPLAPFPAMISLPQAAVTAVAADDQRLIGTGPWRWASGAPDDDQIWLARSPGYWGEQPKLDSLVLRVVPDTESVTALESGWVDFSLEAVVQGGPALAARSDLGFLRSAPAALLRLIINCREPLFADVRVRQALNYAIDAGALQQFISREDAVRFAGVIPPGWPGADSTLSPFPYDPVRARRLVQEAHFPADRMIQLWVARTEEGEETDRIGALLVGYLEAIGLHVQLHREAQVDDAMSLGNADLVLRGWYPDYRDADTYLYPLFHSSAGGSAGNPGSFSDPLADTLIDASRGEVDPARRVALLRRANDRVYEQAANVFLGFSRLQAAFSLRLAGWSVSPFLSRYTTVDFPAVPGVARP